MPHWWESHFPKDRPSKFHSDETNYKPSVRSLKSTLSYQEKLKEKLVLFGVMKSYKLMYSNIMKMSEYFNLYDFNYDSLNDSKTQAILRSREKEMSLIGIRRFSTNVK